MARVSFPDLEKEILKFWEKQDIFKKTIEKSSKKGDFIFYEGPPTANGKPGIHHVLARAFKDVIPRYKTMQGFHVDRKAGWDTHGLPVELQVEKKLEISGKPGIESLKDNVKDSITYFNTECKKSVWEYKEDWEKMTERMGFWLDLEEPYVTYENDYIETLWWIIKQIDNKKLLYKGYKVVPHCPRCGTALSSHEVAQGYKEVEENSVFMKFKVKEGNDKAELGDYILSWTTTPWTLPGNIGLAVGEEFEYVKISLNNEKLILAKALLNKISEEYKIEHEFNGKDLIGISYEPLFPESIPSSVDNFANGYKVFAADFVTVEDGTGIVHTAMMYGEDDYEVGQKIGLPKHHTVSLEGNFIFPSAENEILKQLDGKVVKDVETEKIIIEYLKQNKLLYRQEPYKHDYPFCWRCDTPLLYYAKDSWFIKMSELQAKLKENNEKINWVPEHIKTGRFGEWLEGAKDWALSRERYWGTPLPVWVCNECEKYEVIGSIEELKEKGQEVKDGIDLHRPFIDDVTLKCECGGDMERDSAVLDCWFDSGAMPFAQHHYPFENKEELEGGKIFPADYICEAIDQTRGWFYTLLAISTLLDKGTSYKNVICLGHINDKFGKKMSKSKGNVIDPWEIMDKYGADTLRLHLYTLNQPGETKNFDPQQVEDVMKKNWIILWNVLSFYQMYARGLEIKNNKSSENILDKWVMAKTKEVVINTSEKLDKYDIMAAARGLMQFINEISTWFVRRSRDRFKEEGKAKEEAVTTLGFVLLELSKVLAPFTPFIAEKLYQELTADCPVRGQEFKESVHLENWTAVKELEADEKSILNQMQILRDVVEKALALRAGVGIKIRQPLANLQITTDKLSDELLEILKDEINVKEIRVGDELKLDTEISEELKVEGLVREMTRFVNSLRKEVKLTINDKVDLAIIGESQFVDKMLGKFTDDLKNSTLSNSISRESISGEHSKEIEIEGEKLTLEIKK